MTNPKSAQPRQNLLTTPTLLFALVFAHATHVVCDAFEMNEFMCAVVYLYAFAIPIVAKQLFIMEFSEKESFKCR